MQVTPWLTFIAYGIYEKLFTLIIKENKQFAILSAYQEVSFTLAKYN